MRRHPQSLTSAQWPPTGSISIGMCLLVSLGSHRSGSTPRSSRGCDDARMLSSDTLFTGQQQIRIEHFGAPYRLKIPGQGR
ncbi:hemin uptake protein HemP [Mesorhizobium sp. M0088]|uniref:hemin uptake protein HemP n=1 Tax=unclassified Mesorhizobium TaxID=325217 RepID=UPI003335928B